MTHLIRDHEHCTMWCDGEPNLDFALEIPNVTCRPCLLSVIDYAEDARHRLGELPFADTEAPSCGCRTGAHPPRENYMRAEAEREGEVCKMGWLK